MKAMCPDIVAPSGDINGLGLLQAVKHFELYAETITFNFLHFTVQEFLAAHYITTIPPHDELKILQEKFWDKVHLNMFSIYTALTKGQRVSFKKILSDGNEAITISDKFLIDQLKCLQLYHCFTQANDYAMCNTIERAKVFDNKIIDLSDTNLTANEIECISTFLTFSVNKEWIRLDFANCYIQDHGLHILYHGICSSSGSDITTLNALTLRNNELTNRSSSMVREITIKCKVRELWIDGNYTIGEESEGQQFYSMLTHPSTMLEQLYMVNVELSSTAAISLFTALKENNKLKKLNIDYNCVTDDACITITTALEKNKCLVGLSMYGNPMSSKAILIIIKGLLGNNTLKLIGFPDCTPEIQENIESLQEDINKNRESNGYQVKFKVQFSTRSC